MVRLEHQRGVARLRSGCRRHQLGGQECGQEPNLKHGPFSLLSRESYPRRRRTLVVVRVSLRDLTSRIPFFTRTLRVEGANTRLIP
jgi:hypothetical protein